MSMHDARGSESAPRVAARLAAFDPVPLKDDLRRLESAIRARQPGTYHDGSWEGLSLVNRTGESASAKADIGPSLAAPRPTPLLGEVPAIRSVLERIPGRLCCARLMALGPRGRIDPHRDEMVCFASGLLRLNLPIVSPQGAEYVVDGQRVDWAEGELWFADVARIHHVTNASDTTRVNLIVDVELTEELLAAFPDDLLAGARREGITIARAPHAMDRDAMSRFRGAFALSDELIAAGTSSMLGSVAEGATTGRIEMDAEGLVLHFRRPVARLEPVAPDALHIHGCPPIANLQFTFDGERRASIQYGRHALPILSA